MNVKKTRKTFLHRVTIRDKHNALKKYLAESRSDCDENARRLIIAETLKEGGRVCWIVPTRDRTVYPGESGKRRYRPK